MSRPASPVEMAHTTLPPFLVGVDLSQKLAALKKVEAIVNQTDLSPVEVKFTGSLGTSKESEQVDPTTRRGSVDESDKTMAASLVRTETQKERRINPCSAQFLFPLALVVGIASVIFARYYYDP